MKTSMVFKSLHKTTIALILTASLGLGLTGCLGSKVTKDNYDKVETGFAGMKIEQVKALLGEPTEQQSGGMKIAEVGLDGSTMTWKDGNKSISVIFLNGQAINKTQMGL